MVYLHDPANTALLWSLAYNCKKNIGKANQNILEQKVAITDERIGFSQLLGARARAAPKSAPMAVIDCLL